MAEIKELQQLLKPLLQNAIYIVKSRKYDPKKHSKLGGKPLLPADLAWPYYQTQDEEGDPVSYPLAFLAQLDLSELAPYDTEHRLPDRGLLSFFYEMNTMCWGFSPEDIGSARVFYFDGKPEELLEVEFPPELAEEWQIPEAGIKFKSACNLPDFEEFDEYCSTDADWEDYAKACKRLGARMDGDAEETIKLLGYADLIQSSMLYECEAVTSGIYCGGTEGYSEELQERHREASKDWTLLAQFGSLSDEIMFGDCGCIYFYIKKEDLAARRFDRVHLILQCY